MTRTAKDGLALVFAALAVGVFLANHYAWNVYLVGGSNRWAIGAIGILGMLGCGLGAAQKVDATTILLAAIGTAALVFLIVGLVTGSHTMLTLLTIAVVALWIGSVVRHSLAGHVPPRLVHG
jgi:fatty acid desaturase